MAKLIKPLSLMQVKNAKVRDRSYKLFDGGGLYLEVMPSGSKIWRFKFLQPKTRKEARISLGSFPLVTIKEARNKRGEYQKKLLSGENPAHTSDKNTTQNSSSSFEKIAYEWLALMEKNRSQSHTIRTRNRLLNDVFPLIGKKAISELRINDFLKLLRKVKDRGALETAHRILTICGQIMRYSIITGRIETDPTYALRGALQTPQATHMARPTDPKELACLSPLMFDDKHLHMKYTTLADRFDKFKLLTGVRNENTRKKRHYPQGDCINICVSAYHGI